MVKLMEAKHEHERKRNAVDVLRTEMSSLRIQYYTQPLTWKKRVSALMDKVLEKQQEVFEGPTAQPMPTIRYRSACWKWN